MDRGSHNNIASTSDPSTPKPNLEPATNIRIPDFNHHLVPPPTPAPPPTTISPIPSRYPDTLNTLIEIRETDGKGLGVFACQDILPGTILLCEAPLVTLTDTGSRVDPLDVAVDALSSEERAAFYTLHGFSRHKSESRNRSIVYCNGYSIASDLSTGIFLTASRLNHSCVPNTQYVWKPALGRMLFWNRFKLLADEEITVDYGHRKAWLKRIYGFECMCGGCTDSDTLSDGVRSESGGGSDEGERELEKRKEPSRGKKMPMGSIDGFLQDG